MGSISFNYNGSLLATSSKDKKIRIITTGFSKMSERQYAIWDSKDLSKALKMEMIDTASGVLFPFFDFNTSMVYLAGKGDGNIRYYEPVDDRPYCFYLDEYKSSAPQRGLGMMPKRGVAVSQ